ncbi:MAG: 2OG-Fe(II) oxygenase [Pseudomonadota bacterium]
MSKSDETKIAESVTHAFERATRFDEPYRHWTLDGLFPEDIAADLKAIEFPVADLGGVSGKRELHNDTRHYVDSDNRARFSAFASIANAFQTPSLAADIERFTGADLSGTYLRIEYAQDVEGFWLEPHTDLGVKRLTVLIYLSSDTDHSDLGTDVYNGDKKWFKRAPFAHNSAMMFVPGDDTYHGFEKRTFSGVRKSLILNYVTEDWRDRDQLAFPEETVRVG